MIKKNNNIKIGKNCIIDDDVIIGYPSIKNINTSKNCEQTTIGNNCILRSGTIIYEGVKIGDNTQTGHHTIIREKVTIGNKCIIGTNSVIDGFTDIGNNSLIHSNSYICAYSKIGDSVFIGPGVKFANDKFPESTLDGRKQHTKYKGPTIEKNAKIGLGTVILPGIIVGENSLIGAGSVVTKNVEKNIIVIGNPAKKLKDL